MAGHAAGEAFVLLHVDTLFALGGNQALVGRTLEAAAQGIGDTSLVSAQRMVVGRALTPPSPVHLRAQGSAASGLDIGWVRRSRLGWAWSSGHDVPLGEEQEAYLVEIVAGGDMLRSVTVNEPAWFYPSAAISADAVAAGASALGVQVRQRGTFGLGPAAVKALNL